MTGPNEHDIGQALTRLGNYRVRRAQLAAGEGAPDGVSGALVLALGMRETWGRNVEGGAKLVDGRWIALDPGDPDDARKMDVGWTQINRAYHHDALSRMQAVASGEWGPVVAGHDPTDPGFVPRFEDSLRFTITELREAIAYAFDHGVKQLDEAVRFAVAAHNAGLGGALHGFNAGDVDRYTAGGDYSAWILAARTEINRWLGAHPHWLA